MAILRGSRARRVPAHARQPPLPETAGWVGAGALGYAEAASMTNHLVCAQLRQGGQPGLGAVLGGQRDHPGFQVVR